MKKFKEKEIHTIYKIIQDPSIMRILDCKYLKSEDLVFNCYEKDKNSFNHNFKVSENENLASDFYFLNSGVLVYSEETQDRLDCCFEGVAQEIPIKLEDGKNLFICNTLECQNAFDFERSKFTNHDFESEEVKSVDSYVFRYERLNEMHLFKLPETSSYEIYCTTNCDFDDFHKKYNKLKLNGLKFEKLASYAYDLSAYGYPPVEVWHRDKKS